MAFSVTPTSGASPYTLTIDFANKDLIDGVRFGFQVRSATRSGACEVPDNPPSVPVGNTLFKNGIYVNDVDVPAGSCRVWKAEIVNLDTSEIISTQSVSVDNT